IADFVDQTTQRPSRELFNTFAELAEGTNQAQATRALADAAADPMGFAGQAQESLAVTGEIQADRETQGQRIGGRPTTELLRQNPVAWVEQASAYYANQGTASLPAMMLAIAARNPEVGGA